MTITTWRICKARHRAAAMRTEPIRSILDATIGAALLLVIIRLVRRGQHFLVLHRSKRAFCVVPADDVTAGEDERSLPGSDHLG